MAKDRERNATCLGSVPRLLCPSEAPSPVIPRCRPISPSWRKYGERRGRKGCLDDRLNGRKAASSRGCLEAKGSSFGAFPVAFCAFILLLAFPVSICAFILFFVVGVRGK